MLDIRLIRENPQIVLADLKARKDTEKQGWIKEITEMDKEYRALLQEAEELRRKRNVNTDKITKIISTQETQTIKDPRVPGGSFQKSKPSQEQIEIRLNLGAENKNLNEKIGEIEPKSVKLKEKIDGYLMRLPNILHKSVPIGKDDSENIVVKETGGKISNKEMPPHGEVLEKNGWADFARATKVAGSGFYFLKGDFALLEMALLRFSVDKLVDKGFAAISPPLMMNRHAYEGVTDLSDFESVMYKVDADDLYLIATSEHPMAAMYKDEIFSEEELPLKFAGVSPCFRREIGKHGIDTRGIFRVHQFNKVEQFVFAKPEDSWKIHEELLANAEEIFFDLGIAYRVVNVCSGDIGTVAAKKYDIEAWMPREEKYREVVSNSNCTSYQAVRSNIKLKRKDGTKEYLHTLNSTAVATARALRAIVETHYKGDALKIPKPLQKYMGGAKEITAQK